jgi:hypothetical protein
VGIGFFLEKPKYSRSGGTINIIAGPKKKNRFKRLEAAQSYIKLIFSASLPERPMTPDKTKMGSLLQASANQRPKASAILMQNEVVLVDTLQAQ